MFQTIAECKPSADGRHLLIAASHVANGTGDRLSVYDLDRSGVELLHVDTPWPHAVIWAAARQLLWADSQRDVVGYRSPIHRS